MQELIHIDPHKIGDDIINSVNARDLHGFLEVQKDFSDWIKVQIERARLVEHRDFEVFPFLGEKSGGRPRTDYYLTLDAAKHIGMMSGTDKGFEIRDYFIECERRVQTLATKPANLSRLEILTMAIEAEKKVQELSCTVEAQAEDIAAMEPKAAFCDAVSRADDTHTVTEAAKILGTGQNRLFDWLKDQKYLYVCGNGYMPFQDYLDNGLFRVTEQHYEDQHGRDRIYAKVLVTGKGMVAIQRKMETGKSKTFFGGGK